MIGNLFHHGALADCLMPQEAYSNGGLTAAAVRVADFSPEELEAKRKEHEARLAAAQKKAALTYVLAMAEKFVMAGDQADVAIQRAKAFYDASKKFAEGFEK